MEMSPGLAAQPPRLFQDVRGANPNKKREKHDNGFYDT
jgi:hypothetical protein